LSGPAKKGLDIVVPGRCRPVDIPPYLKLSLTKKPIVIMNSMPFIVVFGRGFAYHKEWHVMFADFPGTCVSLLERLPVSRRIRNNEKPSPLVYGGLPTQWDYEVYSKLRLLTLCSVALHDLAVIKAEGIRRRVPTILHSSAGLRMGQGSFRCYHVGRYGYMRSCLAALSTSKF
jgi:hypothetical protein